MQRHWQRAWVGNGSRVFARDDKHFLWVTPALRRIHPRICHPSLAPGSIAFFANPALRRGAVLYVDLGKEHRWALDSLYLPG